MANDNKKMVEKITSRDVDFAQWYTDIVKNADLADYSGVKVGRTQSLSVNSSFPPCVTHATSGAKP